MTQIEEILAEIDELKYKQRQLTQKAGDLVLEFDGTLKQALEQGIVKLNFTAPPGFYQQMRNI